MPYWRALVAALVVEARLSSPAACRIVQTFTLSLVSQLLQGDPSLLKDTWQWKPTQITRWQAFLDQFGDTNQLPQWLAHYEAKSKTRFIPFTEFPPTLFHLTDPPVGLFVRGNAALIHRGGLAVVGTRQYSHYGQAACQHLLQGLADTQICIWSGLARGIDTLAHTAALALGLPTIAIIGGGFGRLYPKENTALAAKIVEQDGLILSEYAHDTPPEAFRFPERNRLVAALSDAVLVIEGGVKSGSLITAKRALDLGRNIFAVPGSIFQESASGPNWLIQQGATPITSGQELQAHLSVAYPATSMDFLPKRTKKATSQLSPSKTPDTPPPPPRPAQVLLSPQFDCPLQSSLFPLLRRDAPTPFDALVSHHPQASPSQLAEALLLMELDGWVQSTPGDAYLALSPT